MTPYRVIAEPIWRKVYWFLMMSILQTSDSHAEVIAPLNLRHFQIQKEHWLLNHKCSGGEQVSAQVLAKENETDDYD